MHSEPFQVFLNDILLGTIPLSPHIKGQLYMLFLCYIKLHHHGNDIPSYPQVLPTLKERRPFKDVSHCESLRILPALIVNKRYLTPLRILALH
jgi:hypothetical protein